MNEIPQIRQDLLEYAPQLAQELKKTLSVFRWDYKDLGEKNDELEARLIQLKESIISKRLFAFEEKDMDGHLEFAQAHIKNKTLTTHIAGRVLRRMVEGTKDLIYNLGGIACYYNPTLSCRSIHVRIITFPKTEASPEQHAELMNICKKLGEVSECLEELCDFMNKEINPPEPDVIQEVD